MTATTNEPITTASVLFYIELAQQSLQQLVEQRPGGVWSDTERRAYNRLEWARLLLLPPKANTM